DHAHEAVAAPGGLGVAAAPEHEHARARRNGGGRGAARQRRFVGGAGLQVAVERRQGGVGCPAGGGGVGRVGGGRAVAGSIRPGCDGLDQKRQAAFGIGVGAERGPGAVRAPQRGGGGGGEEDRK